jgi:hypothetical protein
MPFSRLPGATEPDGYSADRARLVARWDLQIFSDESVTGAGADILVHMKAGSPIRSA